MRLNDVFLGYYAEEVMIRAGAPTWPALKMMVRFAHSGNVPAESGFNASAITPDVQDVAHIANQASFPGDVMMTIGAYQQSVFPNLGTYLSTAASYPNIKWVYLCDELGYSNGVYMPNMWQDFLTPAAQIQAAGLKTAVTIIPECIMKSDFSLGDFSHFDVIGVDCYPTGGIDLRVFSCVDKNPYLNQIKNCVTKLRNMGFTKDIWYVYESFGHYGDPDVVGKMILQKYALTQAVSLGITGMVSYGYYDVTGTNLASPLHAGSISPIAPLFKVL